MRNTMTALQRIATTSCLLFVSAGELIDRVAAIARVTNQHLHWSVNLDNVH